MRSRRATSTSSFAAPTLSGFRNLSIEHRPGHRRPHRSSTRIGFRDCIPRGSRRPPFLLGDQSDRGLAGAAIFRAPGSQSTVRPDRLGSSERIRGPSRRRARPPLASQPSRHRRRRPRDRRHRGRDRRSPCYAQAQALPDVRGSSLPVLSGLETELFAQPEPHGSLLLGRRRDQLPQRLEDLVDLLVVLAEPGASVLFHSIDPSWSSWREAAARRNSTNALMISMFTAMARLLRSTPESIATPAR